LIGHTNQIDSLELVNANTLASSSTDQQILLWDFSLKKIKTVLATSTMGLLNMWYLIKLNEIEQTMAAASQDANIYVFNTTSGQILHKLKGHSNSILTLDYNLNESLLLSGSTDNKLLLWNMSNRNNNNGVLISTINNGANIWTVKYKRGRVFLI